MKGVYILEVPLHGIIRYTKEIYRTYKGNTHLKSLHQASAIYMN